MNEIERLKNIDVNGAIAKALREQAERSKGCEYCNNKFSEQLGAKEWVITVKYYEVGDDGYHYVKPVFCPMCGKSLKEKADEQQS